MSFEQLRRQLLVAMGVPFTVACWRSQPVAETPPAPQPAPPRVVAPVQPSVAQCKVDQLFETACGTAKACERTGRRFVDVGIGDWLYVTGHWELDKIRKWSLDPAATAGYRARLPEDLPRDGYCCYSNCTTLEVAASAPAVTDGPGYNIKRHCIPAPPRGTRVPASASAECPAALVVDGVMRPFNSANLGECCYSTPVATPPVRINKGRAARVGGEQRIAGVARGSAWSSELEPSLPDDATERARLAVRWLADARLEHASIAAFARLALQLMAHGAPPDLVMATHEAALDEIEHARLCFALASAYAGERVEAAAFDAAAAMSGAGTLEELAIETLYDGCIGETAAALDAGNEAMCATDPVIARVQQQICEDETRHAELAWAILAWCARRGDSALVERLGQELAKLDRDDAVIANVVAPCLGDLLAHV
jgi:hypothetical protein